MADIFDTISTTPTQTDIFDTVEPEVKITQEAQGLLGRFGKQLYNKFGPEAVDETIKQAVKLSGFDVEGTRKAQQEILTGKLGPEEAEKMRKFLEKGKRQYESFAPLNISQAKTLKEKGVDVTASIISFVAKLKMLRAGLPKGTPEGVVWEVQNLIDGGTPGAGAAMHTAFGIPGKVIKGATIAAKAGRLAAESGMMGGLSAVEQLLDTGEVKWEDVAISAGIPVGLHSLAYVKAKLRSGDPKVTKAIIELHPELLERNPNLRTVLSVTPQQRVGALKRFARYAGKEPLPVQLVDTISAQPDLLSMPEGVQTLEQIVGKPFPSKGRSLVNLEKEMQGLLVSADEAMNTSVGAKQTTFGREPNLYRTVSGSHTGITEQEVKREGERYVHKTTGEDVIPDRPAPVAEGQKGLEQFAGHMGILDKEIESVRKATQSDDIGQLHKALRKQGLSESITKGMSKTQLKELLLFGEKLPQPEPTPEVAEGSGGKVKTITARPSKRKGLAPTLIEEQPALIPTVAGKEMPLGINRTSTKVSQWWDSTPAKLAEAKLVQWTKEVVPVGQKERETAVGELHKRQAAGGFAAFRQAWKGASTSGGKLKALLKIKSGFGSKAEVPEFTPPDLTGAQWDIFSERAKEVYVSNNKKNIFELSTTGDAIDKIKRGFVPTPYEFGLLKPVLGEELTTKIWEATRGLEPVNIWDVVDTIRDGFKAVPLGIDIQAARQGSTIAWRHPIIRAQMAIAGTRGYFPWFKGGDPYAKRIRSLIEKDPNYKVYDKVYKLNWTSADPWATVEAGTKIQSYGKFPLWLSKRKFAPARKMGEWLLASERGSVTGINLGLKLLGDVAEKELQLLRIKKPMTPEQIEIWRTKRGITINAALKRIVAHSQAGRKFQTGANWALISPSHTISRPYLRWRAFSTLFTKTGEGDWKSKTYAAQIYGLHLLRTMAVGSVFAYIGQKLFFDNPSETPAVNGSTNPLNPLFGKARWGNDTFDFTGGDATIDRDLARLAVSGYLYGKELITGEQQTQVGGTKIPTVGSTIIRHFSTKEAMHWAFLKTILTGKDWLGRPIESWKAIIKGISPTQLVSIFESWGEDGILEALAQRDPYEVGKDIMASAAVGLSEMTGGGVQSYAVPAYQQERMFLDEMSVRKHNLKWDYLSPVQQARLKLDHKDILAEFDEQKKIERIENPYDPSKLIEEQRKTGKRIKAQLDKPVQQLLEDIDLSVSRSQNNFMLNDKRFNRYQDKLAKTLNQLIPKTRADKLPPGPARRKALESIVNKSKQAAFGELMQEITQGEKT